ncbi:MAG TPA: AraC family transcriptional regulator [Abditibacteriaceae bacterium]
MQNQPTPETLENFYRPCAGLPLIVLRQWFNGGGDTGLRWHTNFWTLYCVMGGRGIHLINEHPYPVARGDVYIVPPGGIVAYRDYSDLSALAFSWTTELFLPHEWNALRALPGFWPLMLPFEENNSRRNCRLHLPPERFRGVEANAREIADELETGTAAGGLLARGGLLRILVHLARWNAQNTGTQEAELPLKNTAREETAPVFADVLRLIEERYAEPLTVPQLAARLFLSTGAFNILFRRETDVSPAAYLRRLRLDRAQTLLRESDESVAQIAARSGFGDAAHFSRAFRAAFGLSPRQYREQWK